MRTGRSGHMPELQTRSGTKLKLTGLIRSRAGSDPWMIAGLMVGALLAAATAAGIPQYGRSLEIVSMRAAVEAAGPLNTNINVSSPWTPLTDEERVRSDLSVFSAVESNLAGLVTGSTRLVKTREYWWGPAGGPLRTDDLASQSAFQFIENLDDHVEYITGRPPTDNTTELDGATVIEVAIYNNTADLLQVEVGDVIDSRAVSRDIGLVRALITGTFVENSPEDVFWLGLSVPILSLEAAGRDRPLVMFPTDRSMFSLVAEANSALPATFAWFLYVDPVFMADMTVSELGTALDGLTTELEGTLARPFVITEMIARVESMKRRALFGSIPLLLMALLVLASVGFYLTTAAGLLARRRTNGYVMLQGRGSSIRQQLKIHAIEAAIVSAPGAVVAPFISLGVISALGYLPAYRAITGGGTMPVELAVSGWVWSFGAAAGTVALIMVASSFWDRPDMAASRASDARSVSPPWFQRYYIDAFLVGLSGILWWELGARNGVVVSQGQGEFTPDISLLAAPVLIVVASSLVALRVFPEITRATARIGARSKNAALALGLASVARRPFFHGWPMLALALAISTGIVAGSVVSTLERSVNEQVLYSTGADIRVTTTGSTGQVGPAQLQRVRELGPVEFASPALRTESIVGTTRAGSRFTLFAIDPIAFQRVAWFRDDFSESDTGITRLVDRLAVRVLPEPITLPPDTTEISLWVRSEPIVANHEIWIVVRDGTWETHTVNLGETGEGWSLLSANVRGLTEPVEVTSVQTFLTVGPDSAAPVDLLVDDLIATTGSGEKRLVIDFDAPDLWTGLPTAEGEDTGFTITAEPENVSGIVEGDAGTGAGSISLGRGSNQGVRGIYRRAVDRPIPVLASQEFMDQTNVGLRRPFVIDVQGGLVPVEVIEKISYFPTLDPARGPFVIADIDAIVNFVELRGRKNVTPNELFASLRPTDLSASEILDSIRDIFRLSFVESRAQQADQTLVDPVAVAGWRGMSVVATIVAAVVVLMAYSVFLAAYALRTRGESALMLALGASRRDHWVNTAAELTPAIVVGTLVGLATGLGVSSLMVGSMAHTGAGGPLLPPFLLQTDWTLPLVTIGAIFAIFTVGIANSVRSFRGIQIARMAREGFSAAST